MSGMKDYAKTMFERHCGPGIRFDSATVLPSGTIDIAFTITATGKRKVIGTKPVSTGRNGVEQAAEQAGRFAALMAEQTRAA